MLSKRLDQTNNKLIYSLIKINTIKPVLAILSEFLHRTASVSEFVVSKIMDSLIIKKIVLAIFSKTIHKTDSILPNAQSYRSKDANHLYKNTLPNKKTHNTQARSRPDLGFP